VVDLAVQEYSEDGEYKKVNKILLGNLGKSLLESRMRYNDCYCVKWRIMVL